MESLQAIMYLLGEGQRHFNVMTTSNGLSLIPLQFEQKQKRVKYISHMGALRIHVENIFHTFMFYNFYPLVITLRSQIIVAIIRTWEREYKGSESNKISFETWKQVK